MTDALDCGTVWATVQRVGSGYVGEFGSYTVSIEHSDRFPRAGCGDSPSGTGYTQVKVTRAGPSTRMVVFGIEDR